MYGSGAGQPVPSLYTKGLSPLCDIASSVLPDTVSLLNVSTRFYLGVHTVRNIARTVYGSRQK